MQPHAALSADIVPCQPHPPMRRCAPRGGNSLSLMSISRCALQGRFTLRDEGRTIAIGKIIKLPSGKKSVGDNAFSAT